MKTAASLALWKRLRMHIFTANGGSREFGNPQQDVKGHVRAKCVVSYGGAVSEDDIELY